MAERDNHSNDRTERQPAVRKEDANLEDLQKFENQLDEVNWDDATDPLVGGEEEIVEVSLDELYEIQGANALGTTHGDLIRTNDGDGSTDDIQIALDQGLVWDPPDDPPVIPSDSHQRLEIAAGFGTSIENEGPDPFDDDDETSDHDARLEDNVRRALRHNSETTTLDDLNVRVRDGVVTISGKVPMEMDMELIDDVVRDLDGVEDIHFRLRYTEE